MSIRRGRADPGSIKFLGSLQKLRAAPGDVFVLKFKEALDEATVARFVKQFYSVFPGHKVIVLDRGADIGVVSPVEITAITGESSKPTNVIE